MRDWLEIGSISPGDRDLIAQLGAPEYGFTMKNQVLLESKELMEKRGIASPDEADALALTFAYPVMGHYREPGLGPDRVSKRRTRVLEYDPLEHI